MKKRDGSLAGWLHLAARNAALFIARKRARQGLRESSAREFLDAYHQPEANVQDRETVLRHLDDELASLTAVQREAVILRYLDGLSEKDAALSVGCAPHTLSCRASDGIANLRKRLVSRGCALGIPALIGVLEADAQAAIGHGGCRGI